MDLMRKKKTLREIQRNCTAKMLCKPEGPRSLVLAVSCFHSHGVNTTADILQMYVGFFFLFWLW